MPVRAHFEFRVSDSLEVPLRGRLLRLRLTSGTPRAGGVAPGKRLLVRAPGGAEREVRILDHAITGGRVNQQRLDRKRELDILIAHDEAEIGGQPVDIGWTVHGPLD